MAVNRRIERELLRNEYLTIISDLLKSHDEDVQLVKSNEIAIPVVGCEGSEEWIVITVKVPTGANKGTEPYNGYDEAENYQFKLREKAEKAKQREEENKKKMAKDAEIRKKKEEQKRNAE